MEDNEWLAARVEVVPYEGHGDKPNVFIQWKGTNVCFDFCCECGSSGHFDGFFAYSLRCGDCGAVWAMPSTVYPHRLNEEEITLVSPVDVDMEEG